MKSEKEYLIEAYYQFKNKLYGNEKTERDIEFEKRVEEQYCLKPNRDLDVYVTLIIDCASGKTKVRSARSLYQLANNSTGYLPDDAIKVTFKGEFEEMDGKGGHLQNKKVKKRLAFEEKIFIVEDESKKMVRQVTKRAISRLNPNSKVLTKQDLNSFKGVLRFKDSALPDEKQKSDEQSFGC